MRTDAIQYIETSIHSDAGVDKEVYVEMIFCTESDSHNSIMKFCTPYAEHLLYFLFSSICHLTNVSSCCAKTVLCSLSGLIQGE